MNVFLYPSLEHIVFVKIAARLWNQHDIRQSVIQFSHFPFFSKLDLDLLFITSFDSTRRKHWQEIEDKIIERVAQLTIPPCLKEKMLSYIQAVGFQILKWMEYHFKCCRFDLDLPDEFCWTDLGTIDKKKTALVLINNDSIDTSTRYKLACVYCLEDNIKELWNKLPENIKTDFYSGEDIVLNTKLGLFWAYYIKEVVAGMDNLKRQKFYRDVFKFAAKNGNKVATEYFFHKLNNEQLSLFKTALCVANTRCESRAKITEPPKEYYGEVLCFLLSQMSNDQQVKLIKECPDKFMNCFLDWPWQSLFIETLIFVLNLVPKCCYFSTLILILRKQSFGFMDYDYKKIFHDVWKQVPNIDKSLIIYGNSIGGLLHLLLRIGDTENIALIFQGTTQEEKKKIFSRSGISLCKEMIRDDKLDILKFFIQFFISSRDEMIKIKKEFKYVSKMEISFYKDRYYEFIRILDNFIHGDNKRKYVEESSSSSAKRHCNIESQNMLHHAKK